MVIVKLVSHDQFSVVDRWEREKNNERKAGDESFEPSSVYTQKDSREMEVRHVFVNTDSGDYFFV